ncbi:MAG: hypothetical protein ABI183_11120 [Polyangiaceae bacterium]
MRLAACCVLALGGGCSLFVSLDGLSDGGVSAPSDGSIEASVSDAITNGDAPITTDGGDAGVCTGFCDNFDNRETVPDGWDNVEVLGNGSASDLSISSTEFVSPPHSLHAHVAARMSGSADISNINKDLPLTGGSMSIDVDVKIVGLESGYDGFAGLLQLGLANDYAGSIAGNGGGYTVVDYWVNFADAGHIQPVYPLGSADTNWHHFHYAAHYDSNDGSIFITVDGVTIVNVTGANTFGTSAVVPNIFNMSIGYSSQPTMPALDVYFDNIQVQ